MRLVIELILILVLIACLSLDKALGILSFKELKRRARGSHDKNASSIYKVAAYGQTALIYLWVTGTLAAALIFIMIIPRSWLWALIYLAILTYAVRVWQPKTTKSWAWKLASLFAPVFAWKLNYLAPFLNKLIRKAPKGGQESRVYEKDDMLEFLRTQVSQPDNRISESELKMAFNALTFGDKKVTDCMTPLRKVRMVSEDELVGPTLMDELHQTGFSRFPVAKTGTVKSSTPDIIGTLFLKDIILKEDGRVRDYMHKKTYFINEAQSLREALGAFLKTHTHLFVVVNNFEEIVGVLSIEDVLEQIIGEKIVDEFDRYDDLRAVAGLEARQEQQKHHHVAPVQPVEKAEE